MPLAAIRLSPFEILNDELFQIVKLNNLTNTSSSVEAADDGPVNPLLQGHVDRYLNDAVLSSKMIQQATTVHRVKTKKTMFKSVSADVVESGYNFLTLYIF